MTPPPTLQSIFSENLARYRDKADDGNGISQSGLAARAGLSPSTVAQLEQGRRLPSLDTIQRLADAMGMGDRPWKLLVPRGER